MKFINTTTNETLSITIVDPKTGVDMIADLLQPGYDQNLELDDEGDYQGDAATIEYYRDMSGQYQEAYDLMHEIKQYGTDTHRQKLEEILEDAQGYETNDWAGYVIKDIKENGLV